MAIVRFVKSFSKGQITIPKEIRKTFDIKNEFWLKLSINDGKIIAEPIKEEKTDTSGYLQKLLTIKGSWLSVAELTKTREEVAKRIIASK